MRFEVENNADIGMAQFQLLQDALVALGTTGPNQALQGTSGNISGKAKQLDQAGGAVQIGALFDQIRHLQKRIARASWNRIKQFWTAETWIRVTDDEQKLKFVGLNVPVSAGEQQVEQLNSLGLAPEEMQYAVAQIAMNPMSQVPVAKKNDVARMDVDIVIEESPDVVTVQEEQFRMLIELAKSGAVVLPPDVLIEASGLRNKQKLLEKIKGGGELTPEQQEEQAEARQMQKADAQARVDEQVAKADKTQAEAEKVKVDTAVTLANAADAPSLMSEQQEPQQ
jgi:hypothetical protein